MEISLPSFIYLILVLNGMSQNKVYSALEDLDGEANTDELREKLNEKYPDSTLHKYATQRLRSLEEKGVVELIEDSSPLTARIIDDEWEGVPENISHQNFPPQPDSDE